MVERRGREAGKVQLEPDWSCENQHLIDLLYSGINANVQTEPPVGTLAAA
jgi:hypothetical protein